MGKRSSNRKTAEEALRFLDNHMLDPTPSNYSFAYLYLTGVSGSLRKSVDEIIFGGVRLTQAEVDALMGTTSEVAGGGNAAVAFDEYQTLIRHQALSVSDLTAKTLRDTSDFGRDLSESVEQVSGGADLVTVVRAMIERTAEVERKLAETSKETERLRLDLDAARDDASRDALTNLPNRRAADRKMQSILKDGSSIAVAFCDIDRFKSINDRFGHAVGDRVLKTVAEALSETLEPHTVARFGGEEFVVLLPGMDAKGAFQLIERAREIVAAKNFRARDTGELIGQVTFSAGIATTDSDPDEALRTADAFLYEAKSSGRNRTIYKEAA
jgi:diguanylate cyclase